MLVGQFLGARMGSRLVLSKRTKADPPDDCYCLSGDECQITLR